MPQGVGQLRLRAKWRNCLDTSNSLFLLYIKSADSGQISVDVFQEHCLL